MMAALPLATCIRATIRRPGLVALAMVGLMAIGWTHDAGAQAQAQSQGQSPAPAVSASADGKRKINLAGRQRMLSQYMAKGVCFASLGVDSRTQANEIAFAHDLFGQTLKDLRHGSAVQELQPVFDYAIIGALDAVADKWAAYSAAVVARDLDGVARQNLGVLSAADEAVSYLQSKYAEAGAGPLEVAIALNIAGRQRMLTQKASKEFCFIAAGRDVAANQTSLKGTVELFEFSLRSLRDGNPQLGLKPASAGEIIDELSQAERSWSKLRPLFAKAASGAPLTPDDIATVARDNVAVMKEVNAVVELYELSLD